MFLTIGGVYATWIYSGSQVDAQTEPFVSKMGGLDHEGNAGIYTFSHNSLDFSVEPNNNIDKVTTIIWGDGNVTLTFTPKGDITPENLAAALGGTVSVELASDTAGTYGEQTIYTITENNSFVLPNFAGEGGWTEHNQDGTKYYTFVIDASMIDEAIAIGNFALPTENDYVAFKAAIQNVKFRLRVTPGTLTVNPDTPDAE